MDYKDWLIAIIPMIISVVASYVLSTFKDKKLRKQIAMQQALHERINILLQHVQSLRNHIHDMQFQLGDVSMKTKLKDYFVLSGNLQIYIEDTKNAMQFEVHRFKKDYYNVALLENLLEIVGKAGVAMENDNYDEFAQNFKESEKLCHKLIDDYNRFLAEI